MRAIFISYRREDAEGQAGRLFDDLVMNFGDDSVFMDVAGLEPGRDFRRAIDEQVASCGVLLAVIGKGWLEAKDESGRRRLDDPMDFVRLETASALKRDIPVIPVLVRGASMPRAEDLPEDLKELAFRNGVELTHPRWDSDVQVLVKALRPFVQAKPEPTGLRPPSAPIEAGPTRRGSSRIMIIAVLVSVLVLAFVGYLWRQKSSQDPSSSRNLNTEAKSVQSPAQDVDTKTKEAATNDQQESAGNADEELHELAVENGEIATRIGDLITLKRSLAASNKITRGEEKTLTESMVKVNDAFKTFTGRLMQLDKQPPPITRGNREELALLFDAVVGTVSELIDSSIKPIKDAEAKAQLNGAAFSLNTRVRNIKDILEKAKTKG
jgi:hypothetical protein